jgi:AhpD family alkylhydroperoxidase
MAVLQVFEPPMCCSTGVCGPSVDPVLPRFAADLEWLKSQGVDVERYNLAQQPSKFVETEVVKKTLAATGNKCLPLILVDGQIVSEGTYPSRDELAALAEIAAATTNSLYTRGIEELVALGAAIAANCTTCFQYHFAEACKAGVSRDDIALAVATARKVKEVAAAEILKLAGQRLAAERDGQLLQIGPCCTPSQRSSS